MSHWQMRSAALIAAVALLTGCDSTGGEAESQRHKDNGAAFDAEELRAALPARGSLGTLNEADPVFPGATLSQVCLAGAPVTIYEYRTSSDRKRVSDTIDPHGSPIGTAYVDWVGPPHFYARGRVIALTLTDSRPVNEALTDVLGLVLTPDARSRGFSRVEACGAS